MGIPIILLLHSKIYLLDHTHVATVIEATYNVSIGHHRHLQRRLPQSAFPGASTTIAATGGSTYEWYDGATLISTNSSVTVTPATQTQYACIDASGCQTTVPTVSVNPIPDAPVNRFLVQQPYVQVLRWI